MSKRWSSYEDYLASESWVAARTRALVYADYRCQVCNGAKGLEVHHRVYGVWGKEHPADLTVLCSECHGRFHESPEPEKCVKNEHLLTIWEKPCGCVGLECEEGCSFEAIVHAAGLTVADTRCEEHRSSLGA